VRVLEDDTRRVVPCGRYALALDVDGARALRFGACDPATHATEVVLVDRAALFAPGEPVAIPRTVAVSAVAVRHGATAGGAVPTGGVDVRCTATVRPFVADLLNGANVYLSPEYYRLEPLDLSVRIDSTRDLWVVSAGPNRARADAAFRVVDVRDGHEVLRSRVVLQCATPAVAPPLSVQPTTHLAPPFRGPENGTWAAPFRLPAGAVGQGSTVNAPLGRVACSDGPAPTVVWRFVAPADGRYEFLLRGGYDTVLEVRGRSGNGASTSLGCNDDDDRPTHSRVVARLTRGEAYDLVVSGYGAGQGWYAVTAIRMPTDVEVRPGPEGYRVDRVDP
jgi:hypothetical protein